MSLSPYPNLRLKITPTAALKLKFLPAIPGSNAAAAETAAAASAAAAVVASTAASVASSASAASAISAAISAASPQAVFQVLSFAADAKHWALVAKNNSAGSVSDQQIAMKATFFN